ncbi:MAG: hypothetical protein AABY22_13720 [Nanoarchaeota archaeon]
MKNKSLQKFWVFMAWLIGFLITLLIGGLFYAGQALNLPLLKYLPLIVHKIIGIFIIVFTIVGVLGKIFGVDK